MSLTYANIELLVPTTELCEWIEKSISPSQVYEFSYRAWPGRNLVGLAFAEWMGRRPIQINRLYWPRGASRWAVGHFLCSQDQLEQILPTVFTSDTNMPGGFLFMDSGSGFSIDPLMYLLPPRPLSQFAQAPALAVPNTQVDVGNGCYLLTLVDERYYWWGVSTSNSLPLVTEGITQWLDVYDALELLLQLQFPDFTLSVDQISANYLKPSSAFNLFLEPVPVLLDAVAYNVGQRIVRDFTGNVSAYNYTTAKQRINQNFVQWGPRQAGGLMDLAISAIS